MEIVISKSKKPDKKFDSRIDGKRAVSFGQKGASDYTKHKDKERKARYIDRHEQLKIGLNQVYRLLVGCVSMFFGISHITSKCC